MSHRIISVIGLGYIGLPTAILLASYGHRVIGVDVDEHVVSTVNAGKAHIAELGVEELCRSVVHNGALRATTTPEAAEVFIIAVPTPFKEEHKPDLRHIEAAVQAISPVLTRGNLVMLESTSPVGTTEHLAELLASARPDLTFAHMAGDEADIQLAYCPERVLPGNILHELVHNDRIVGGLSAKASKMAAAIYKSVVIGEIIITDARTAELCKLAENSFRDVNIAFANELSMICDTLNVNVDELIRLANRHPRVNILQPGIGVGGHCIPVDPWFIVDGAPEQAKLIRAAREVNDAKPQWVVEEIKAEIVQFLAEHPEKKIEDVTVACLGLTYKADVADMRNSPAVEVVRNVSLIGCQVLVAEPFAQTLSETGLSNKVYLVSLEEALSRADVVWGLVRHRVFQISFVQGRRKCHDQEINYSKNIS